MNLKDRIKNYTNEVKQKVAGHQLGIIFEIILMFLTI